MCKGGGEGGGAGGFNDVSSMSSPFGPATGKFGVTQDTAAVMDTAEMEAFNEGQENIGPSGLGDAIAGAVAGTAKVGIAETQDQTTAGLLGSGVNAITLAIPGGSLLAGLTGVHNAMTRANVNDGLHPDNPNAGNVGTSITGGGTASGPSMLGKNAPEPEGQISPEGQGHADIEPSDIKPPETPAPKPAAKPRTATLNAGAEAEESLDDEANLYRPARGFRSLLSGGWRGFPSNDQIGA